MAQSKDDSLANDLDWSLVCYAGTEEIGEVAVIHHDGESGKTTVKTLDVESQGGTTSPVFLNLTSDSQVALLDAATK